MNPRPKLNPLKNWVPKSVAPLVIGLLSGALLVFVFLPDHGPGRTPAKEHAVAQAESAKTWTCSMHPQIQKAEPGSCPICGMDLIASQKVPADDAEVEGRIRLSPRALKLAALRTSEVVRQRGKNGQIRLLGKVAPNEETLKNITAWIDGRIDRLHVKTTGERVHAGQKVATLYSPEVYAAHQDLITAATQLQRLEDGTNASKMAAQAALEASRRRLTLLGVPDEEVTSMEGQKKPTTAVAVRSPFSGTVMERLATEGSYVTTGARLYSVANLGSLWIELDAYESDLALLSVGQKVKIEVEAYPGESFEGEVTFIDPTLDQRLRTSKVRVKVDNPDGRLRPGMFAQALVDAKQASEAAPLIVPASAPLFTGRRAVVYVEVRDENGLAYDARTVRLGPRLGDSYPVVAGLAEGERVVSQGAFALDADLQIRGGKSMMQSPDDTEPTSSRGLIELSVSQLRQLRAAIAPYLVIQKALAEDQLAPAQKAAAELSLALPSLKPGPSEPILLAWQHLEGMLSGGAQAIAQAESIEQARKGFEHLSGAVIMVLRTFGNPLDVPLSLAHCPMARGSEGANWVQEGAEIENSYFGAAMRSCGDVQAEVAPGAHLTAPSAPRRTAPSSHEGHRH